MDGQKMNQLADDVHLITAPVRIVADWIKIVFFLLALPIVFVASFVHWLFTGKPIMSPDEIWLTKILLTVLSPWITTFLYILHRRWRIGHGYEYRYTVPTLVVFLAAIFIEVALLKCYFYFGGGSFYDLPHLR